LKLLLDEMYPSLIAGELRARGHDVVSVHETPGRGTPDDEVFDHARSAGRAIVTENIRDYRPLAEALLVAGESHAGVVFTTEKRWPRSDPGALIAALEHLLASTSEQPIDSELWL
jgi:predicted nuclease of predicted toxin-antitoxin system